MSPDIEQGHVSQGQRRAGAIDGQMNPRRTGCRHPEHGAETAGGQGQRAGGNVGREFHPEPFGVNEPNKAVAVGPVEVRPAELVRYAEVVPGPGRDVQSWKSGAGF